MNSAEYARMDAMGLAELVRKKEVQPIELVEVAIARIERYNPPLNAVIDQLYDAARKAATNQLPAGPLAGVPYLIKDMVAHDKSRMTMGSPLLAKAKIIPPESHEVVKRSEGAGLIVVGKTNIPELGLLPITEGDAFGPTRNPWDLTRSPGGSSGGTAAAVAVGMVPLGHGNDGGGSIRIPAAACGVFGLKPSRGRNPGSVDELPAGVTVEHCLSRSVRDSAALLDLTRGPLPGDRWWAPPPERPYLEEVQTDPRKLRIAFSARDLRGQVAHPDCVRAVHDAADLCAQLGHEVEEARPDIDGDKFWEGFIALWALMPSYFLDRVLNQADQMGLGGKIIRLMGRKTALRLAALWATRSLRSAPVEALTARLLKNVPRLRPTECWLAWEHIVEANYVLGRFLEDYDLILTPVLGEPPVPTGEFLDPASDNDLISRVTTYAGYTPVFNTSGLPAMSVPLYWNDAGLPVGVQFGAKFGDETTLFQTAGQLERARPWAERWPPMVAEA